MFYFRDSACDEAKNTDFLDLVKHTELSEGKRLEQKIIKHCLIEYFVDEDFFW